VQVPKIQIQGATKQLHYIGHVIVLSKKYYEYEAFVSYNKADVKFAEKLVKRIEKECVNGQPIKVFFAEWDIEPGENILLKIEKAESSSHFIIPIMSPDWLKSDWTTLERVIPVHDDPAGLKARIIPIMRRSCEPPPSMRILRWLNFETDSNFEKESKKLIGRIQGKTLRETMGKDLRPSAYTGQIDYESLTADMQEEEISSNVFILIKTPDRINVALSTVKRRKEIFSVLAKEQTRHPLPSTKRNRKSTALHHWMALNIDSVHFACSLLAKLFPLRVSCAGKTRVG
jgi:hypothetical protein